jgi:hypothetical protein
VEKTITTGPSFVVKRVEDINIFPCTLPRVFNRGGINLGS